MAIRVRRNHAFSRLFEGHGALLLTVALSFSVVALNQLLHTAPARLGDAPAVQVFHWMGDALITLPLVAAAVWGGHLIADRVGLGTTSHREVLRRALLISGLLAVCLVPGWFVHNEVAGLTQGTDALAAHSHTAHSADAYWVPDPVVYLLLLAPLAVMAAWAGYRMAAGPRTRPTGVLTRSSVAAALVAVAAGAAWLLHEAANRADASRVLYTTATQSALVHSHAFFAKGHGAHLSTAAPATAAPFSFAYQVARAVQDGLVAQAVGLPVAALVLLWGAWLLRDRDGYRPQGRDHEEVARV